MNYCKTCGRPITFGIHERTRRRIPLDPDPVDGGNVWITGVVADTPVVRTATKEQGPPEGATTYISHFATCPDAAKHRRKKGNP